MDRSAEGSRRAVAWQRMCDRLAGAALIVLICAGSVGSQASVARAADPRIPWSVDPAVLAPGYRVEGGQQVTAQQAHTALKAHADMLMIDVRTHGEILFNGIAVPMHRHIPYVQLDADHSYDAANQRYKLEPNPDFVKAVDNLLAEHKRDRAATIILYCTIGERSARAASLLAVSGFTNVYSVVDGFEGEASARAGPGWKASGLPWVIGLTPSQAYKSPSM